MRFLINRIQNAWRQSATYLICLILSFQYWLYYTPPQLHSTLVCLVSQDWSISNLHWRMSSWVGFAMSHTHGNRKGNTNCCTHPAWTINSRFSPPKPLCGHNNTSWGIYISACFKLVESGRINLSIHVKKVWLLFQLI